MSTFDTLTVVKRSGQRTSFQGEKIALAIQKASELVVSAEVLNHAVYQLHHALWLVHLVPNIKIDRIIFISRKLDFFHIFTSTYYNTTIL